MREAVGKLCDDLAGALYEMRRQNEKHQALKARQRPSADGVGSAQRPRIFVGFVTEDLEIERGRLAEQLRQSDAAEVVAPDRPVDVDDIRTEIAALVEECHAVVQICGRGAGGWRVDADGFVLHQITQFEAKRRPVMLVGVSWLQLADLPATSGYANALRAKEREGKLNRVAPTVGEIVTAIDAQRRRTASDQRGDPAAGELPECIVFIPSRREYKTVEEGVRGAMERLQRVRASVVPLRPIWDETVGRTSRDLPEVRRRRASEIDGEFLLLAGFPDLEEDDFFVSLKLRRQASLQGRLPVAVVDGIGGDRPTVPQGFHLLRLTDANFDTELEAWLIACAMRQKASAVS
jgi:hypothetical protein